jgi:peptidoglycan-associated lipoprotein
MMHRRSLLAFAILAGLTLAACGSEPPPPPAPEPMQEAGPNLDSLRAYEDSVRAAEAERQRLEAERMVGLANARAILEQRVHFDYDESALRSDAEGVLRQKVAILRASPQVQLRIEGHADERGSVEYNLALGNRRAQAVVDFFVQQGLAASRFQTTSFGEERPLVNQSNESAWGQNRRAEFIIFAGGDQINPGN